MEEKRLSPEEKVAFLKKMSEGKKAKASTKGRSPNQGVKLLYIRDYLHKETNKEHPASAKKISEHLASKGIKADRKTIYNDILRLQVEFQEPIDYNPNKKGYYIAEPTFSLYELQMLMDSVRAAKFLSAEEVSSMCKRIAGLTNIYDQEALIDAPNLTENHVNPIDSELKKAALIQQAIQENKKISFRQFMYYPTDSNRSDNGKVYVDSYAENAVHVVSPKELIRLNEKYALVCFCSDPRMKRLEDVVYFLWSLDDIKILSGERECIDLEYPFLENETPSLFENAASQLLQEDDPDSTRNTADCDTRINNGLNRIREEIIAYYEGLFQEAFDTNANFLVRLSFKTEASVSVLEHFGHDIVIVPESEEYCTVTMPIQISRAFFDWLFSVRTQVRIVSPLEIQEAFRNYVSLVAKQYEYWEMEPEELVRLHLSLLEQNVQDKDDVDSICDKYCF